MPDIYALALGAAVGFCAAFIVGLALRLHGDSEACAEWERTWEAECARHDATLVQLHALQAQGDVAATNIVQLSHALLNATHQLQEAQAQGSVIGANPLGRFSRN